LTRLDISLDAFFPFAEALVALPLEMPAAGVISLASAALLLRLYRPSDAIEVRARFSVGREAAGGGVDERDARFLPLRSTVPTGEELSGLSISMFQVL